MANNDIQAISIDEKPTKIFSTHFILSNWIVSKTTTTRITTVIEKTEICWRTKLYMYIFMKQKKTTKLSKRSVGLCADNSKFINMRLNLSVMLISAKMRTTNRYTSEARTRKNGFTQIEIILFWKRKSFAKNFKNKICCSPLAYGTAFVYKHN